eukprot:CAMPEP_0201155188 /NCGR_PEP_ID=MMETSP0851-20130426/20433_1 /ASSEMBLY_ACC=CAM_ASM_000631 /TAXON_ID=183588 /ORGANISM="Pseudo-nitzschia fraudulenta, Strain WWA7" /LENGTH=37 /DNA_ID= /DNA_START= /DNA_END= /DNA_ORIENTATION=
MTGADGPAPLTILFDSPRIIDVISVTTSWFRDRHDFG